MVSYGEIKQSNARIHDDDLPRVSVFVGGTSGIGQLTIKALVATMAHLKIYLVGRKSSKDRMRTFMDESRLVNPRADIIWVEGEISLLAETKRIAEEIKDREPRIDLLFLTAGYAPSSRVETSEGIDIAQSLEYYSRIAFIQHLLPSLTAASAPRIISVLAGGMETTWVAVNDPDLKDTKTFRFLKARLQHITMNTVAMEKLADDNPGVVFMHVAAGSVNTGNLWRSVDGNFWLGWFLWLTLHQLIRLLSMGDEEVGQRHLFHCTSAAFGSRGIEWEGKPGKNTRNEQTNGLFLVSAKSECIDNAKVVSTLRKEARPKLWEHTQNILGPYLR